MTTLTFHVARGLGREWGAGDEIVLTELDHHANVAPWQALATRTRRHHPRPSGCTPKTGQLDWAATGSGRQPAHAPRGDWRRLERARHDQRRRAPLAGSSTRWARCCSWMPSTTRRTRWWTSMRSAATCWPARPTSSTDRTSACSTAATICCRARRARSCAPAPSTGARSGSRRARRITRASSAPAAAVDFLASLDRGSASPTRRARARNRLRRTARARSRARHPAVRRSAGDSWRHASTARRPITPRTPTIAFVVKDRTSDEVARELVSRGLFLSNGDFYAPTVVARLGHAADGVVRAGCACYTTEDEVERLIAAVGEIAG